MFLNGSIEGVPENALECGALEANIVQACKQISIIYKALYPFHKVRVLLVQSEALLVPPAVVIERGVAINLPKISTGFLGQMIWPGLRADSPEVTVLCYIPRAALPSEIGNSGQPWAPHRFLGWLFRLSPAAYEQLRYAFEVRKRHRLASHHSHVSLPLGRALSPLSPHPPSQRYKAPSILIGFHWLEVGGAEKLAFDCVQWALAAGLRVFVVASHQGEQSLAQSLPQHEDVSFIRLDRYLPHSLWAHYIERLVEAENLQIIHIHHCNPLYESLAHLKAVAPWLKVIDSTHVVEYGNGGYPRLSGVWSEYIDAHHVISQELTQYMRDMFQVLGKVKLGRMLPPMESLTPLSRVNLRSKAAVLRLAFVGRFYYQKRPVVLALIVKKIAAWAMRSGIEFECRIIGSGPFENHLRALLRRFGLNECVMIMPPDSDVASILKSSDILLLPSNNEGLALVCYEAIAQGCIPISTNVGAQNEVLPPDLLVDWSPRGAISQTLHIVKKLWADPVFLAQQEAALHEKMRTLQADPAAKDIVTEFYQQCLEKPQSKPSRLQLQLEAT